MPRYLYFQHYCHLHAFLNVQVHLPLLTLQKNNLKAIIQTQMQAILENSIQSSAKKTTLYRGFIYHQIVGTKEKEQWSEYRALGYSRQNG